MARTLYAAAPSWSGLKHRFVTLSHIRTFANYWGYEPIFLWGMSEGVAGCPFEDLLAPIPGMRIINVPELELVRIEQSYRRSRSMCLRGQAVSVYRPGRPVRDRMFAFDLWGDFAQTTALEQLVPPHFRPTLPARALASPALAHQALSSIRRHHIVRRLGIRVRVTENPADGRRLCRHQRELDRAVKSIICIPWHVPVFMVTDSEYIQQMLASHFRDAVFLPKQFTEKAAGGYYVDRRDPAAMRTFVMEVECLAACRKIVNLGGFLNEESFWPKMIYPPYDQAV